MNFRISETLFSFFLKKYIILLYLDITQGLTPDAAISTILSRMWLGSGRPLMKTPPSWFTLPWPGIDPNSAKSNSAYSIHRFLITGKPFAYINSTVIIIVMLSTKSFLLLILIVEAWLRNRPSNSFDFRTDRKWPSKGSERRAAIIGRRIKRATWIYRCTACAWFDFFLSFSRRREKREK